LSKPTAIFLNNDKFKQQLFSKLLVLVKGRSSNSNEHLFKQKQPDMRNIPWKHSDMGYIHLLAQHLAIILLLHISAWCISHWYIWIQELTSTSTSKMQCWFWSTRLDPH